MPGYAAQPRHTRQLPSGGMALWQPDLLQVAKPLGAGPGRSQTVGPIEASNIQPARLAGMMPPSDLTPGWT